jgi:hypothetical protein
MNSKLLIGLMWLMVAALAVTGYAAPTNELTADGEATPTETPAGELCADRNTGAAMGYGEAAEIMPKDQMGRSGSTLALSTHFWRPLLLICFCACLCWLLSERRCISLQIVTIRFGINAGRQRKLSKGCLWRRHTDSSVL